MTLLRPIRFVPNWRTVQRVALTFLAFGSVSLFASSSTHADASGQHYCEQSNLETRFHFSADDRWTGADTITWFAGFELDATTVAERQVRNDDGSTDWAPLVGRLIRFTARGPGFTDQTQSLTTDEHGLSRFTWNRNAAGAEQVSATIEHCKQTYDECMLLPGVGQCQLEADSGDTVVPVGSSGIFAAAIRVNWEGEPVDTTMPADPPLVSTTEGVVTSTTVDQPILVTVPSLTVSPSTVSPSTVSPSTVSPSPVSPPPVSPSPDIDTSSTSPSPPSTGIALSTTTTVIGETTTTTHTPTSNPQIPPTTTTESVLAGFVSSTIAASSAAFAVTSPAPIGTPAPIPSFAAAGQTRQTIAASSGAVEGAEETMSASPSSSSIRISATSLAADTPVVTVLGLAIEQSVPGAVSPRELAFTGSTTNPLALTGAVFFVIGLACVAVSVGMRRRTKEE